MESGILSVRALTVAFTVIQRPYTRPKSGRAAAASWWIDVRRPITAITKMHAPQDAQIRILKQESLANKDERTTALVYKTQLTKSPPLAFFKFMHTVNSNFVRPEMRSSAKFRENLNL